LLDLIKSKKLSVFSVNKEKLTPLMQAIDLGFSVDTVDKLVKAGSDINAHGPDGMTPLHMCFYNNEYQLFDYLVHTANADLQVTDESGEILLEEIEA